MKPLVSAIVLGCNEKDDLRQCLEALLAQDYRPLEVIYFDNGSQDGSAQYVRDCFAGRVHLAQSPVNLGCSGGRNAAIRRAKGKLIQLCDANAFLEPTYISTVADALLSEPTAGMAQGKILRYPHATNNPAIIDSTGIELHADRRNSDRGSGETDCGQFDRPGEMFGAGGTAPLYRRTMLDAVAEDGRFFDEVMFIYREEVDLAWRARRLGFRCLYIPKAQAWHRRTYAPHNRSRVPHALRVLQLRNRYILLLKNDTTEAVRRDLFPILWFELRVLTYVLLREPFLLKAYAEALALASYFLSQRKREPDLPKS